MANWQVTPNQAVGQTALRLMALEVFRTAREKCFYQELIPPSKPLSAKEEFMLGLENYLANLRKEVAEAIDPDHDDFDDWE